MYGPTIFDRILQFVSCLLNAIGMAYVILVLIVIFTD